MQSLLREDHGEWSTKESDGTLFGRRPVVHGSGSPHHRRNPPLRIRGIYCNRHQTRPFISGEFTVSDIKRANYSELFFCEEDAADRWFKCKLFFITLDEKSGAEKKTAAQMLAQASNLKDAIAVLEDGMKGTLADYTIASVTETQLMDVFPFDANSVPAEKKSEEELIAEQKKQAETREA